MLQGLKDGRRCPKVAQWGSMMATDRPRRSEEARGARQWLVELERGQRLLEMTCCGCSGQRTSEMTDGVPKWVEKLGDG